MAWSVKAGSVIVRGAKFKLFSVIEHLPQELRDRFTEMRELDLTVQSKGWGLVVVKVMRGF